MSGRPSALAESTIQDFRERAIVENEALLGVNHGDAFDHAAQDGAGAVAFAAEQADFAVEARGGLVERVGEIGKFIARAFAQQGTEVTFGNALRKTLQALDARGEYARESEGDQTADEQHDEGGDEQPLAKFDEREINLRKRHRQADYDRIAAGAVIALGAVNQFAAEGDAAMDGLSCAAREGILNLGTIRVVFHFVRVGFGISEDAAGVVNDGYARATAGGPAGPVAEFGGVV